MNAPSPPALKRCLCVQTAAAAAAVAVRDRKAKVISAAGGRRDQRALVFVCVCAIKATRVSVRALHAARVPT